MVEPKSEMYYPNIGKRIKAVLIDSILFVIVTITILPVLAQFEFEQAWIKILIILSPYFVLDPLLVSFTGGSVGHHVFKIRVQNAKSNLNVNLLYATFRFIAKTLFGSLSLVFILFTKKHQAFHDLIVNSIVVLKSSRDLNKNEGLKERTFRETGYIYPSKIRRFLIIVLYNASFFIILSILTYALVSDPCIDNDKCTSKDDIVSLGLGMLWLVAIISSIYFGVRAKLYGCMRIKNNETDI